VFEDTASVGLLLEFRGAFMEAENLAASSQLLDGSKQVKETLIIMSTRCGDPGLCIEWYSFEFNAVSDPSRN